PTAAAWPPTSTPRLAGFEHALVRREVRDAARARGAGAADSGRVLLAMGGSDPLGATPALTAALAAAGLDVTAALGPGYAGPRPPAGDILARPEDFAPALAGAA